MTDRSPPKPPRPSRPEHEVANVAIAKYHERSLGARVDELARLRNEDRRETEDTVDAIRVHMSKQDRVNADQSATLALVARELGLEKKLPESIRGSLRPPPLERDEKKQPPAPLVPQVAQDARRTKFGIVVMLVITLLEFLDHAIEFAAKHF